MRRPLVLAAVAIPILAAAALIPLALTGVIGRHGPPMATAPPYFSHPAGRCATTGCAVVNTVRTTPRVEVLYGAACAGLRDTWFLNITEGGGNDVIRPAYKLKWSFLHGATTAEPDGTIVTNAAGGETVKLTLAKGALVLSGTDSQGKPVDAAGTLSVSISGTSTAPTLVFTETGLSSAESQLQLSSPFDTNGQPLVVPITMTSHFASC